MKLQPKTVNGPTVGISRDPLQKGSAELALVWAGQAAGCVGEGGMDSEA